MIERVWNRYLTDHDNQVLAAAGFGQSGGFGHRPALLIVDVNCSFVGDKPEPILESVKRWPLSCGDQGWKGIAVIRDLLVACRAKRLPIIYTTPQFRLDGLDTGSWSRKIGRIHDDPGVLARGGEIVSEIAPEPHDIVITKQRASPFHGAPLLDYLVELKIDTLLVTGTTTAGCVRAAVVDAVSYNYLCIVVEDACFDRVAASHALSLFDMHIRYADVLPSPEVLRYIDSLPDGLFVSPESKAVNF